MDLLFFKRDCGFARYYPSAKYESVILEKFASFFENFLTSKCMFAKTLHLMKVSVDNKNCFISCGENDSGIWPLFSFFVKGAKGLVHILNLPKVVKNRNDFNGWSKLQKEECHAESREKVLFVYGNFVMI